MNKDDKEEGQSQSKKFLKSSKGPATPASSSTKSFLKQSHQVNAPSSFSSAAKKLATTLESDEFDMERKPHATIDKDDDDYEVNIDDDIDEDRSRPKEISNRYSDDFDESKSHRNFKNNNTNSIALSSMSLDQKRKSFDKDDKNNDYDDEIDEGDEEMSEQASSSKPSQQSVIQRKPNNNTSKTLCYNCCYDIQ